MSGLNCSLETRGLLIVVVLVFSISFPAEISAHAQQINGSAPDDQQLKAVSDEPPDLKSYWRPAIPGDYFPLGRPAILPKGIPVGVPLVYLIDTVVFNTDPTLENNNTCNDGEPSIAINPDNLAEIVITAFSGYWGGASPLFQSTDGGSIWTKQRSIPIPPGIPLIPLRITNPEEAGVPSAGDEEEINKCTPREEVGIAGPTDQTVDFQSGAGGLLSGTFLAVDGNIYSGTTVNPALRNQWDWTTNAGLAVRTNCAPGVGCTAIGNVDQPWLLVDRQPAPGTLENVYVAYDDFTVNPVETRVAVSLGQNFLNFMTDEMTGTSTGGGINPGHRLAVDPSTGTVYSLFQQCAANCAGDPKFIAYVLNRSTDGGMTWPLELSNNGCDDNGGGGPCVVVKANSTQPDPKFCGVNALLGGVDHIAVDPQNSDVYIVYGDQDAVGNNRLSIVRLGPNGTGGLKITGGPNLVTTTLPVDAALPSVAVANDANHTVAVLYDTCDDPGGPTISAHIAFSTDRGDTFQDVLLQDFLSPSGDDGDDLQRVLGDYQQLKAVGPNFFGVFSANGVPFGRPTAHIDPIYVTTLHP